MAESIQSKNILLEILVAKKWRLLRHALMLIILVINFYPELNADTLRKLNIEKADEIVKQINKGTVVIFFVSVIIIYLNLFLLIPRLLLRNKYFYYFTACAIIAILYFLTEYAVSHLLLSGISKYVTLVEFSLKSFIDSVFIPFIFLCATAGYKVFKKWITDTSLLAEMKEAKIQDELTNLKNQINPHFLFNTLNNLNILIASNPAKASAIVLGLSDVLRYQLYEANAPSVLLRKDIEIVSQFLELEKIRRDNFQFGITITGEISGAMVPPFIFINFVENAIKHSADNKGFSYIAIEFIIAKNQLVFCCKNSKPPLTIAQKTGGLGLKNIQRRLELMYGKSFDLAIKDEQKEFIITLKLPL
jgi:Histidine kinase